MFELIKDDFIEKNVAERLWGLFDELLETTITVISQTGSVDIQEFRNSVEYQYLKSLFEDSFLGTQLIEMDIAS